MRILLASNYQPPHMGGIEFAAEALKRCWEREGHQVTWITTDLPLGGRPSTADNIRIRAFNGFERWMQVNTPFPAPWSYPRIARLIREHDVVSVQSLAPGLTASVLRASLACRKKTIVTQHVGIIPLQHGPLHLAQKLYLRHKAEWSVRHGAKLTFVGKAVRDWFLEQTHIQRDSVTMTPAGIDPESYYFVPDEEREVLRTKWKLNHSPLSVLFVGRFYTKKGLEIIQAVAKQSPDMSFTLVGKGPVDPRSWGLANVRVIDFVSTEELRELYGSHDVFLMPSVGEGWPAVIPQAMATGLGCIISEETFEGYNKDADRFVVLPRDPILITQTLKAAAQGEVSLFPARKELSAYSIATWNWQKTARIYLQLWEEMGI